MGKARSLGLLGRKNNADKPSRNQKKTIWELQIHFNKKRLLIKAAFFYYMFLTSATSSLSTFLASPNNIRVLGSKKSAF